VDDRRLGRNRPLRRAPRIELDDVVYGIHAVEEALNANETLRRIHVGDDRKRDAAVQAIVRRAEEAEIPVRFESRAFFANFPYKAHQGVVAFGTPFDYAGLDEILASRRGATGLLVVVLDHVTDPHNLGAIIRSAECAGAAGLVIPERRAAGVNATVRKASAGASAFLSIARVSNIAQAIRSLKKARVWVAGADLGDGTVPYASADFNRDVAVVIGAEGAGLSPLVRRECDYLVSIPILGKTASLNASVAAGVLLYEAVRQRGG